MTVAELIEALKAMPQDAKVFAIAVDGFKLEPVVAPTVMTHYLDHNPVQIVTL